MKRLEFIDIAKGIAIIVMVLFHSIMGLQTEVPGENVDKLVTFENYILLTWFMPIFFVIVGYCSNFDKSFIPYIKGITMSIGLPIFFFDIIPYNIENLLNIPLHDAILQIPLSLVRFFRYSFWFLRALFMGKLLYWFVNKYARGCWKYIIVAFAYLVACIAILTGHIHGTNSLIILLFILVGQEVKKRELMNAPKFGIGNIALFSITMFVMYMLGYTPPFFLDQLGFGLYDVLFLPLVSLSGSLSVMYISKFLTLCKPLSIIGKHTLLIYCLHLQIFKLDLWPVATSNMGLVSLIGCLFAKVIVTILICVCISWIVDRPYLRILIGKKI